jgi:hypothetical protein
MVDTKIEEALLFVSKYAGDVSDWKTLKKELVKCLPVDKRRLFSKRDPRTKQQNINALEKEIADRWKEITSVEVIFS